MDGMNTLFDCQKDIMVKNVDSLPLAMSHGRAGEKYIRQKTLSCRARSSRN